MYIYIAMVLGVTLMPFPEGKIKYIVSYFLIFAVTYWILTIFIDLSRGYGFSKLFDSIDIIIAGSVGVLIGTYIGWNKNKSKYNKIIGKKWFEQKP